uniref:Uncharacterized protein n=1 Tax=Zea mays TaxID=4577 RepID=C4J542_MAIZE|nr:unknown [Zea mays]
MLLSQSAPAPHTDPSSRGLQLTHRHNKLFSFPFYCPEPPERSGTKRSVARSSEGGSGGGDGVTREDLAAFGPRPDRRGVGGGKREGTRREKWGGVGSNSPGAPFPIQSSPVPPYIASQRQWG